MTTNKNTNEADDDDDDDDDDCPGWFYHAPANRKDAEPVDYPAMSQIPGLTDDDGPPAEPPRSIFRETDTKYIRLAKQGGRTNLLSIKENEPSSTRPQVLYPRNEWFYLEDNTIEDAIEKKKLEIPYDFLRPEYMVHEPYSGKPNYAYERPRQGPIAHDKLSVFEREPEQSATDKTVKLPELTKPGYGIRSGKPLKLSKNKSSSANTNSGRGPQPLKYLPLPEKDHEDEEVKPKISKILSYAYEREWQDQLKSWQEKQDSGRNKHQQMTNVPLGMEELNMRSEYAENFGKHLAALHSDSMRNPGPEKLVKHVQERGGYNVKQTETQRLREALLHKPVEKDLFKMTRFKNIPARIECHRLLQSQPQPVAH